MKDMHQELKAWGHPGGADNALILKSDGEPAIVAVREAFAICHGGRVTPERLPRGEHQANGMAEEAGRTARYHARVLNIHLHTNIGREVEASEPIMPWLIRWAAMAVSRYSRGKDGRSPYERQKGRRCDMEVVPFGEVVLHRLPEVATERPQALEERWAKGVWLGHARASNTSLVATDNGGRKSLGHQATIEK